MKKKMRFLTCTFVVLPMLATYTYFNRSAYITKYDWKKTSDNGTIGGWNHLFRWKFRLYISMPYDNKGERIQRYCFYYVLAWEWQSFHWKTRKLVLYVWVEPKRFKPTFLMNDFAEWIIFRKFAIERSEYETTTENLRRRRRADCLEDSASADLHYP